MKILSTDEFELSTGKTFYANNLIIGLAPNDSRIYDGYDGHVYLPHESMHREPKDCFTKVELVEISDFMINLWTAYKNNLNNSMTMTEAAAKLDEENE